MCISVLIFCMLMYFLVVGMVGFPRTYNNDMKALGKVVADFLDGLTFRLAAPDGMHELHRTMMWVTQLPARQTLCSVGACRQASVLTFYTMCR